MPRHGHPHSNGKGHVLTKVNGKQFVKIPSERVWKLQRRRRQEVEIKECVHDGSEVLTENQQADTFVSMTMESFGEPAAGNAMTLDALLSSRDGREEAAAPSHRKQAALLPTSAASSSSCSNPFGTGGAFGSLGGTEVLATTSSEPGGAEPMSKNGNHLYWLTRSNHKAACAGCGGTIDAWTYRLVFQPYVGDVIPKSDALKKWGDSSKGWKNTFWKYFHIRRTCLNHPDLTPPLEHVQCDVAMLPKREKETAALRRETTEAAMLLLETEFSAR